ncbi:MAG: URC4/urg3 family protein [Legionella sp.]|nr:URC4/urg3 family protein [Legionella sp.]
MNNEESRAIFLRTLNDPHTIRSQSHRMLALAKANKLEHFSFNQEQMIPTASFIIEVIKKNYPNLDIPYHSRWRHFEAGTSDRIGVLQNQIAHLPQAEQGKILYELAILSVFLDAGAGPLWQFKELATGTIYRRSEGLALASLNLFQAGTLSASESDPFRIDAERLIAFTEEQLSHHFQVSSQNPLEGIKGRVALLNKLGRLMQQKPDFFGEEARLGNFYSSINTLTSNNTMSALTLFQSVLKAFNEIWPTRLTYHGVSLGDVWTHQALKNDEPGSEYIPFHKLSQWLTYSLIEPLELSSITVTDLDALTGLPEYRNGGLLIDMNLLHVNDASALLKPQDPGSEMIIEWRGLTVALLDELAKLIRQQLNLDSQSLPLAKILQGGTWDAGRQIARQKRPDGTPPIQIISDGTIF